MFDENQSGTLGSPIIDVEVESVNDKNCRIVRPRKVQDGLDLKLDSGGAVTHASAVNATQSNYGNPATELAATSSAVPPETQILTESPLRFGANNSAFRAIEPPKLGDEDDYRKAFSATPGPKGALKNAAAMKNKNNGVNCESPFRLTTRTPSRGSSSYIIEGASGSKTRTPDQFHLFGSEGSQKRSPRNLPSDFILSGNDFLSSWPSNINQEAVGDALLHQQLGLTLQHQQQQQQQQQQYQLRQQQQNFASQESQRDQLPMRSEPEMVRPKYTDYKSSDLIAAAFRGTANAAEPSLQPDPFRGPLAGASASVFGAPDVHLTPMGDPSAGVHNVAEAARAQLYPLGVLPKATALNRGSAPNESIVTDQFVADYSNSLQLESEREYGLLASEAGLGSGDVQLQSSMNQYSNRQPLMPLPGGGAERWAGLQPHISRFNHPARRVDLNLDQSLEQQQYQQAMQFNAYAQAGAGGSQPRNVSSSFPPPGIPYTNATPYQLENVFSVGYPSAKNSAGGLNLSFPTPGSVSFSEHSQKWHAQYQQQLYQQQQQQLNQNLANTGRMSSQRSNHRYGSTDDVAEEYLLPHNMTGTIAQPPASVGESRLLPPRVDNSFELSLPTGGSREKNPNQGAAAPFGRNSGDTAASESSWKTGAGGAGAYQSWPRVMRDADAAGGQAAAGQSLPRWAMQYRNDAPTSAPAQNGRRVAEHDASNHVRSSKDSVSNSSVSNTSANGANAAQLASSRPYAKNDFSESQQSKAAYKEFSRQFREHIEKESTEAAKRFAFDYLEKLPKNSAQWRIYLEVADLAKRENSIEEARHFFVLGCSAESRANNGWVEWSKMEEELGDMERALSVLEIGLEFCVANEGLMARVIKLEERLHRHEEVREKLGTLKSKSLEKVWKSIMEGALFEARNGRIEVARDCFRFLMQNVSWYGPIYLEAFRVEEKEGNNHRVRKIIDRGLQGLPRYGPLWFGLMRIEEQEDYLLEIRSWQKGCRPSLGNLAAVAERAVSMISKELTWRVYFEYSQAQERAAEIAAIGRHQRRGAPLIVCRNKFLDAARQSLVKSLLLCPTNLRWRVLIMGARLEISVGRIAKARELLHRAFHDVPGKSKSSVYLECSRLEEFCGNVEVSKQILLIARNEVKSEWKVYLEWILVEARNGCVENALGAAQEAVNRFPGTGRLWSVMIQLLHRVQYQAEMKNLAAHLASAREADAAVPAGAAIAASGAVSAGAAGTLGKQSPLLKLLGRAFKNVPKSGEVWCERARCVLNPLSLSGVDLSRAQRSVQFAVQFTPQYGDSFVECLRLEMLCQVLLPRILHRLGLPVLPFLEQYLSEDTDSDMAALLSTKEGRSFLAQQVYDGCDAENRAERGPFIAAVNSLSADDFPDLAVAFSAVRMESLRRRCINADPNYGSAWFHCRDHPYQMAAGVLERAKMILTHELCATQKLYTRVILRYVCELCGDPLSHLSLSERRKQAANAPSTSVTSGDSAQGLRQFHLYEDERTAVFVDYTTACSGADTAEAEVEQLLPMVMLDGGSVYCGTDFVTGIVDMNRCIFRQDLPIEVRRRNLFGADQIVS